RLGADAEEALDCVQDAFVSFIQLPLARSLVGAPEDSAKMLSVLLRHIVWSRRSTLARRRRPLSDVSKEPEPAAVGSHALIAGAERVAVMRGCLQHMARLQRVVVELSLVDDLSGQDVAKVLGISHANVRVLLHRARGKLRTCAAEGT